jgi:alkanesulfonate monooxygenase SsuD/methylene tetrahydromethanopterin reductase-like flavin-dependent oxidoreductase (luciferase family)
VRLLRDAVPDTPMLIAAGGPRLLTLAARVADTVAFGWPPNTAVAAARQRIEVVRAAAGSRADDVELAAGLIAVGDGAQPWLERAGLTAAGLAAEGAVTVITGSPRQMIDELQRRRDALGLSYYTVPVQAAEQFAPVAAALAGR